MSEAPRQLRLLDRLARCDGGTLACGDAVVVVAHPDDETIGLGGQLARLRGIHLICVTDGAPADMGDARSNGLHSRADCAAVRRRELEAAAQAAGLRSCQLVLLGVADQEAAFRMCPLAHRLGKIFRQGDVATALTHAYEGGHPDHDATALAVHAACHILRREGRMPTAIIEFPLYHARASTMVVQEFATPAPGERAILLDPAALATKWRMLALYETQRSTLASFTSPVERFRPAPAYDFSTLPNGGDLLYERYEWGLDGAGWLRLAEGARHDLGLPRCL